MEHLALLGNSGGREFTHGIRTALKAQVSAAAANATLATISPTAPKVSKAISINSLLKKLYNALPGLHDYNSSSLCLYSGPAAKRQLEHFRYVRSINFPYQQYAPQYARRSVGWLGMGDAHLHDVAALQRFQRHYQGRFELLSTLLLPHHGSRHNYDSERIQLHRLLAPISPYGWPIFVAASNRIIRNSSIRTRK